MLIMTERIPRLQTIRQTTYVTRKLNSRSIMLTGGKKLVIVCKSGHSSCVYPNTLIGSMPQDVAGMTKAAVENIKLLP